MIFWNNFIFKFFLHYARTFVKYVIFSSNLLFKIKKYKIFSKIFFWVVARYSDDVAALCAIWHLTQNITVYSLPTQKLNDYDGVQDSIFRPLQIVPMIIWYNRLLGQSHSKCNPDINWPQQPQNSYYLNHYQFIAIWSDKPVELHKNNMNQLLSDQGPSQLMPRNLCFTCSLR